MFQSQADRLRKVRAKTTLYNNKMRKPKKPVRLVLASETIFHSFAVAKDVTSSVINFETPVNISDINILSPSMYSSTANGGIIIGGTDPEQIQIKFQCNNVNEEYAVANVELGTLNYEDNKNTKFKCANEIWTNRLIVIAKFSVLSIVVYGRPKNLKSEAVIQINDPSTIIIPSTLIVDPMDIPGLASFADYVMGNIEAEVNQEFDELSGVRRNNQ